MIKKLIELANLLDGEGFVKEANHLDGLIKRLSDPDDTGIGLEESYASIVSSYVESHPNEHEFDLGSAGLPSKYEALEESSE